MLRVLLSLVHRELSWVLRKVTLLMLVLLRMSKLMLLRLLIVVMRVLRQLRVVIGVNWLLVGNWLSIDGSWWWLLSIDAARLFGSTSTWTGTPRNRIHSRINLSYALSQGSIAISISIRRCPVSFILSAPQTLEMLTVYVSAKVTPAMVARDRNEECVRMKFPGGSRLVSSPKSPAQKSK